MLSNFKNVKQESEFDETQRLMCSVPGCGKRWSIHLDGDKPKCSDHQWKPSFVPPITQAVQHWQDGGVF
jgi:hypothetical protein